MSPPISPPPDGMTSRSPPPGGATGNSVVRDPGQLNVVATVAACKSQSRYGHFSKYRVDVAQEMERS